MAWAHRAGRLLLSSPAVSPAVVFTVLLRREPPCRLPVKAGAMGWDDAFRMTGRDVLSRAELIGLGATSRSLTAAVRGGALRRPRRDHYCLPSLDADGRSAVRIGGRLTCVSALRSYGVFAVEPRAPHVHLSRAASRLRAPAEKRQRLTKENRGGAVLHWQPLIVSTAGDDHRVGLLDALAHVVRCQQSSLAIASIDNAWHLGLIDEDAIAELFARLPQCYAWMRSRLNPLAEAGQETVLRLIVEGLGLRYEIQVHLDGLGRVDIVVEDVLVLEADSRAHHDGWSLHVRDRERDLQAARLGYASLRPAYQHTMEQPELVSAAIERLVALLKR